MKNGLHIQLMLEAINALLDNLYCRHKAAEGAV